MNDATNAGQEARLERLVGLRDPAARAAWIYGQPMQPCPKCGSYDMKPQTPIVMHLAGTERPRQLLGKWARATKQGATPLDGPCYYQCWDCGHKGPAVDCTGRTSEDVRADRAVNAEMKRLWNSQARPNGPVQAAERSEGRVEPDVGQEEGR